jgi:uncharacterized protein YjbI with pentapeptide repeats
MANKEQLSILKLGVEAWNGWRAKNLYVYADLNEADLNGMDLSGADLRIAHLRRANLFRADLSRANLSGADLSDVDLREANLSQADLSKANLNGASLGRVFGKGAKLNQASLLAANLRDANFMHANLADANLMVANLGGADLSGANLSKTNLTRAHLFGANLHRADLSSARLTGTNLTKSNLVEVRFIEADLIMANVSESKVGSTVFASSELSRVIGLESLDHRGPSHISMDTFVLSAGKIPEVFLRGCGLSDADIEYTKLSSPDLGIEETKEILKKIYDLRAAQALQVFPLFLSYSHFDSVFVDKVGKKLYEQGIRFWHDNHEMKAGQTEKQTDRAVHQDHKVLLILSKSSVQSDWMEHEIEETGKQGKETERRVLYPVALDDSWKHGHLLKHLMEHNILDFSAWKRDSQFDPLFHQMMDALELFYKQ